MDEEDDRWLNEFNGKMEGSSGSQGVADSGKQVEVVGVTTAEGKENQPLNGRERRKGKDKEKERKDEKDEKPSPLVIHEDIFEYVMGVFEKYTDDTVPTLHTVSLLVIVLIDGAVTTGGTQS